MLGGWGNSRPGLWRWDGAGWSLVSSETGPDAVSLAAAAFDTERNVMIVHGGNLGRDARSGATWEWDGRRWRQSEGADPGPWDHHAASYDASRREMVVFGGVGSQGPRSDTWLWNGRRWRQAPTGADSPPPLYHHAMAYDARRGRTVLFGGVLPDDAPRSDQVWEWDGERWERRAVEGASPTGRSHHRLAYDPVRGEVVLFGGNIRGQVFGDTWSWDGARWRQYPVEGPAPRWLPAMAFDQIRQRIVLVGGQGPGQPAPYDDVWEWDGAQWKQVRPV